MRRGLTLGLFLICGCSLDTKPLVGSSNSVTADHSEQTSVGRAPSLSQTARTSRFQDAGAADAAEPTQVGSDKSQSDAAMAQDAAAPEPPPKNTKPAPMKMEATGGAGAAAARAGAGGAAGSSAGAAGATQAGAPAPTTSKQALIATLTERAGMNGGDALVMRALIAQLDNPFPANAGSLRLLLGNAITSFGCPSQMNPKQCAVICEYVGDSCLTCAADQECRGQMVLVCPNALTGCLP